MILKEDYWSKHERTAVSGAANFRKIRGLPIYSVAQPTLKGIANVINSVTSIHGLAPRSIVWINLREEPLIYINKKPYVLRDRFVTLRNSQTYSGITPQRLENLESKLKQDVCAELDIFNGKILLHSENLMSDNDSIIASWEYCEKRSVLSLYDAMTLSVFLEDKKVEMNYHRVPVTSESIPMAVDLDHMVQLISAIDFSDTAVVLNCQIGIGRSNFGTVIAALIVRWLTRGEKFVLSKTPTTPPRSYQVILSLLRVIRNAIDCKNIVDEAVDACDGFNMRDNINDIYVQFLSENDKEKKSVLERRGIIALTRYFTLIMFQSYLDQNPPGVSRELVAFGTWSNMHPEFDTIREEFKVISPHPLNPITGKHIEEGFEVEAFIQNRQGAVFGQGTILKYDVFPGAQVFSLIERVEGLHNLRRVDLNSIRNIEIVSASVIGVGMPSKSGIKRLLNGLNETCDRKHFWTSLREEPVIYVKGRPHVLRLWSNPFKNLEATGISRERVLETLILG